MFTCTVGSEQTAHNITTTLKYEANSDFQFYEFGPRFQTLPLSKCIISVKSNVLGVEGVVPVALLMDNIVGNATTTDCPE